VPVLDILSRCGVDEESDFVEDEGREGADGLVEVAVGELEFGPGSELIHAFPEVFAEAVVAPEVLVGAVEEVFRRGDAPAEGDVELFVVGAVGAFHEGIVFPLEALQGLDALPVVGDGGLVD
jgi:hypothetical protein